MDIEVLVSTMNNNNPSLLRTMNIKSDAIIINQCDKFEYSELFIENKTTRIYSFDEIGVGRSRNSALIRADRELCLMADDDMVYVDDYELIIKNAFQANPNADMIVFNVRVHTNNGVNERVKKNGRVRLFNSLKYGTVSFCFKKDAIYKKNISFSLMFGGGAKYGSGEDSLFIWDVIKSGLKVYSVNQTIADIYNYNSTWFDGYSKKYFKDRGALYKALSKNFYWALILFLALRRRKIVCKDVKVFVAIKMMFIGAWEYYHSTANEKINK